MKCVFRVLQHNSLGLAALVLGVWVELAPALAQTVSASAQAANAKVKLTHAIAVGVTNEFFKIREVKVLFLEQAPNTELVAKISSAKSFINPGMIDPQLKDIPLTLWIQLKLDANNCELTNIKGVTVVMHRSQNFAVPAKWPVNYAFGGNRSLNDLAGLRELSCSFATGGKVKLYAQGSATVPVSNPADAEGRSSIPISWEVSFDGPLVLVAG